MKNDSNLLAFRNTYLSITSGLVVSVGGGSEAPTKQLVKARLRQWKTKAFTRLCMARWGAKTAYEFEQKIAEAMGTPFYPDERPKAIDRMLMRGEPGLEARKRRGVPLQASERVRDYLRVENAKELALVNSLPCWRLLDPRQLLPDELDVYDHELRVLGAPPPLPFELATPEERRMYFHFYYVRRRGCDPALGMARALWELRCQEAVQHVGRYIESLAWLRGFYEELTHPVLAAINPELRVHVDQCFGRISFPLVQDRRDVLQLRRALLKLGIRLRTVAATPASPTQHRLELVGMGRASARPSSLALFDGFPQSVLDPPLNLS